MDQSYDPPSASEVILVEIMTPSNGKNLRITGPLWGESTGHRWIPFIKASDAELWFFFFDVY